MRKSLIKFNIAFIIIIIYEIIMVVFKFDGVSIPKLIITGFVWISIISTIHYFSINYKKIKTSFPPFPFLVFWLLVVWNVVCVVRSLMFNSGAVTTVLGNKYTSLAFLTPFVIAFAVSSTNLTRIITFFFRLLKIGVFFFIIFFVVGGGSITIDNYRILNIFFLPVVFLISTSFVYGKKRKILVFITSFLLLYVSIGLSARTMFVRELLLFTALITLYFYKKFNIKLILHSAYVILIIPIMLIQSSMDSGESFIEQQMSSISDEEMSADTRTLLYMELYEDLVENKQLIFGKGVSGTYYSHYFSVAEGDSENRLTIEVGVLSILLKTGLVGVLLYLILFFTAIYYAFYKSKNYFVIGIGFMLLVYVLLMFIENIVSYSSNNIFVLFFIGVCLSKDIRNMSNSEIKRITNSK